jgi:hypothetical protein
MAASLELPSTFSQGSVAVVSGIIIRIAELLLSCVQHTMASTLTDIHSSPFQVGLLRQIPKFCSQLTGLHLNKEDLITAYFTPSIKHASCSVFRTEPKVLLQQQEVPCITWQYSLDYSYKVKANLAPHAQWRGIGGLEVKFHSFLTLALERGELLVGDLMITSKY